MKTIFLTSSPQITTATTFFYELAKGFVRKGYRVVIIYDKKTIVQSSNVNIECYTWPNYRPTKFKDFLFLIKLLHKYKPYAIISSFGAVNVSLICSCFLGVTKRIAWIHTKSSQLRIDSPKQFSFLRLRKAIILKLFSTEIHTNSLDTAKDITQNYFYTKKIKVISFLLKKLIDETIIDKNIISFVGRLDPSKGQDVFLKAIPHIDSGFRFKYYIVGSGKEMQNLKGLVDKLKINDKVIFTGSTEQSQVYNILKKSKLHISASKDEAFGMVNIEALSCGVPILAPKVGGIKEILKNNYNGMFFDTNSEKELANKINKILRDESFYQCLKKGALESFESHYELNNKNIDLKVDYILS